MAIDIKEVLKEAFFLDEDLPTPEPIITIGGKIIATAGNFITINGLPKSRKTTFMFYFLASALKAEPVFDISVNLAHNESIVLIDTEQGIYDFTKQIKLLKYTLRSKKLPAQFSAYLFRKFEPDTILASIYNIMVEQKPKILIIDNLTELVINPNDMIESKKVIQFLKLITAEFNCVVICLLHLAKSNLQSLGNLGSYADRSAQSVLKVTLDKETGTSTLDASLLRSDAYFNPVSIVWSDELKTYEQTEVGATPKKSRKFILMELTAEDHHNRLNLIFREHKQIIYAELIEDLKKLYGVGTNIAKQQILPYLAGNDFIKGNKGIYTL